MTDKLETIRILNEKLHELPTCTIEDIFEQLNSLSIGLAQHFPILFRDTRMFRVRKTDQKPTSIDQVGAPPAVNPSTGQPNGIGRLNGEGQSVLYLSDSPVTAFSEARTTVGEFCLSEWRVDVEKLAMTNGGISPSMLAERFQEIVGDRNLSSLMSNIEEEQILSFFRGIFTLDVGDDHAQYKWSIACGMANGFSHEYDRQSTIEQNGMTNWEGRYPFSGVVYPSVRMNKKSLNYAFNDIGMTHLKLNHVQWVARNNEGEITSLDFANSWDSKNRIEWLKRPANFQLKPGEGARAVKVAETRWKYETLDGSIPWFS